MMLTIDRIDVERGGSPLGVVLPNKDRLDSVATFWHGDTMIISSDTVNTDPTTSWAGKGGIVAESVLQSKPLRYIYGPRRSSGINVLHIFKADQKRFEQIKSVTDLTLDDLTVDSLIPNPTNGGRKVVICSQFHGILKDKSGDGTSGCFSTDLWQAISTFFCVGDKGSFNLYRKPGWDAPEQYRTPEGYRV